MKRLVKILFIPIAFLVSLSSCGEDKDAPFPSLITELADCPTDDKGIMGDIILDDDTRLPLTNPQQGLKANVTYRALAGYTLTDERQATLYSLVRAAILHDSTAVASTDPVNVVSVWCTKRYVNLHLLPKTQGGEAHGWGFITDSIRARHAYLRLHHRQGADPAAYSTDVYASLPLTEVGADTVTLRIHTFGDVREWTLPNTE